MSLHFEIMCLLLVILIVLGLVAGAIVGASMKKRYETMESNFSTLIDLLREYINKRY